MKQLRQLGEKIPTILSSPISIFIYIFLFFYLVIFALLSTFIPIFHPYAPSATTQLIMGNYTNVLSALGASLAAGTGISVHTSIKALHKRHDHLEDIINQLHHKISELESSSKEVNEE